MARPVSLRQIHEANLKRARDAGSPTLPGTWKPVHSRGRAYAPGVTIGTDPGAGMGIQGLGKLKDPPRPAPDFGSLLPVNIDVARERTNPLVAGARPGPRGKRIPVTQQAVIYGTGTNAVAAGSALVSALGGVVGATALAIQSFQVTGTTPTQVLTYVVPTGYRAYIENLTLLASAFTASSTLFFAIWRSGRVLQPEFQFLRKATIALEFPAEGDQVIQVMVRNPDTLAAWSISLQMDVWIDDSVRKDG